MSRLAWLSFLVVSDTYAIRPLRGPVNGRTPSPGGVTESGLAGPCLVHDSSTRLGWALPAVLASASMLRAKLVLSCVVATAACGGGGAGGKIMADLPEGVLAYEAPDIDEITGIEPADEADADDDSSKAPDPAPPAAATPATTPATKTPPAAKPAAKAAAKPAAKPAPAKPAVTPPKQ